MSIPIWVQTACNGYQQTTKEACSKERVNKKHFFFRHLKLCYFSFIVVVVRFNFPFNNCSVISFIVHLHRSMHRKMVLYIYRNYKRIIPNVFIKENHIPIAGSQENLRLKIHLFWHRMCKMRKRLQFYCVL